MLQNSARFLRQLDILPPDKLQFPITVIGAGAIGSATALTLAKMGCSSITVWDHDLLEPHNVSNQLCKPSMVGRPKVEALRELLKELADVEIGIRQQRYSGQRLEGVVISAVDNMSTRKEVWKRIRLHPEVRLLIDPRMGGELARIYSVRPCDPGHIEFYESNLYDQKEAERLPCSARAIIYCPTAVASLVACLVKKFAMSERLPTEIIFDLSCQTLLVQ